MKSKIESKLNYLHIGVPIETDWIEYNETELLACSIERKKRPICPSLLRC